MTTINLIPTERTTVIYVNHVEVTALMHDVTLVCARIPTKFKTDQLDRQNDVITIDSSLELVFPATMLDGLIQALTDHRAKVREMIAQGQRPEPGRALQ